MAKSENMVSNTLYIVQLERSDNLDYGTYKTLELTDDFLKSHKILKVPILHREKGAYWSKLRGYRKGYCNRFRFKLASITLSYIDEMARYFGRYRYFAILPTDLGMRVFYAPYKDCRIELTGQDPLRHTCHLYTGPTYHPFYYTNVSEEKLDSVAKWIIDEIKDSFYMPPEMPSSIEVKPVEGPRKSRKVFERLREKLERMNKK